MAYYNIPINLGSARTRAGSKSGKKADRRIIPIQQRLQPRLAVIERKVLRPPAYKYRLTFWE